MPGSSASSQSRESRSWVRGNNLDNRHFLVSDGIGPYFSSPSDISITQQWTPPAIQEISPDDYCTSRRDVVSRLLSFSPGMEGTSAARDSRGSSSPRSDSSCEYESMFKLHSSHRSRCFMSKSVYPLSIPSVTPSREFEAITPQRERHHSSSATSSLNLTELPEPLYHDHFSRLQLRSIHRCELCERLLSQKSPWGSRGIVKTGDMPITGVLSCQHIFHAECLEQTTPKAHKSDPPCPICAKLKEENAPDLRNFSKFRSSFPRLKPFREAGPSKTWGCAQAGDCVEGAMRTPTRNTLVSLNRSQFQKHQGNPAREFPRKVRKTGSFSSELFFGSAECGGVGSSETSGGSSFK